MDRIAAALSPLASKRVHTNGLTADHLYVFDSNGNVNANGYPLCANCPEPPANLTAR